MANSFTIILGC